MSSRFCMAVACLLLGSTMVAAVPPWKSAYVYERNRRRALLQSARSGMSGEVYREYKKALTAQEKVLRDAYRFRQPIPAELNYRSSMDQRQRTPAPVPTERKFVQSPQGSRQPMQQQPLYQSVPRQLQPQRLTQPGNVQPNAAPIADPRQVSTGPASYRPRDIIEWRLRTALELLEQELSGSPQAWQQQPPRPWQPTPTVSPSPNDVRQPTQAGPVVKNPTRKVSSTGIYRRLPAALTPPTRPTPSSVPATRSSAVPDAMIFEAPVE